MTGLTNPKFDYDLIDKQEAAKLRYFEGQLEKSRKKVAAEVIEHGNILRGAQEVLADHHDGVFGAWLDSIGLSRKAAYRAIAASKAFGGCDNCHNLEVSAMYELASHEDAKNRALKLADKGTKVTHDMAKKLIAEAAERDAPKPPKRDLAKPVPAIEPHVEALDGETIDVAPVASVKDAMPTDKCPNCAAVKWTADDEGGWACGKCHHPYGEPVGDVDAKRINENRAKAVSRTEALMRDLDDLNHVCRSASHGEAMDAAQVIWKLLKAWK